MDAKAFGEKLAAGEVKFGDRFWVADYRHKDVTEKPIRHVQPQLVEVTDNAELPANKRVYYADFHFRPVGKAGVLKQVIAPFDATGFRGYTGVSVGIFTTEAECKAYYVTQCQAVLDAIVVAQAQQNEMFDRLSRENLGRIGLNS